MTTQAPTVPPQEPPQQPLPPPPSHSGIIVPPPVEYASQPDAVAVSRLMLFASRHPIGAVIAFFVAVFCTDLGSTYIQGERQAEETANHVSDDLKEKIDELQKELKGVSEHNKAAMATMEKTLRDLEETVKKTLPDHNDRIRDVEKRLDEHRQYHVRIDTQFMQHNGWQNETNRRLNRLEQ